MTRGEVTAATNWSQLSVNVLRTSAARGIRTIRLRYSSVYPSVRLNPGRTFLLPPRPPPAAPGRGVASVPADADIGSANRVDLVELAAVVEVHLLCLAQRPEQFLHGEQLDR